MGPKVLMDQATSTNVEYIRVGSTGWGRLQSPTSDPIIAWAPLTRHRKAVVVLRYVSRLYSTLELR